MDHEKDDSDHPLPMPPDGHPLRALGSMLSNLLDDYAWADAEHLLLTGWDQDRVDRETGAAWRKDNSLEVWFPITAEKLEEAEEDARRFRWLCDHPDWYFIERLCRQFTADSATVFRAELRRVIDESRRAELGPNVAGNSTDEARGGP